MRSLLVLTAAAVAAGTLTATAGAHTYRVPHQKAFASMTTTEKRAWLLRQRWHDVTAIRWLTNHEPLFVPRVLLAVHARPVVTREYARWAHDLRWYQQSLRTVRRNLRRLQPRAVAVGGIAHAALWECIHRGEGAWNDENSGHNSHYGGLQMTLGWDGLVSNAALLSPEQQMAAAETGYRQSGYSMAWLNGQWGETLYLHNGPHGESCVSFV